MTIDKTPFFTQEKREYTRSFIKTLMNDYYPEEGDYGIICFCEGLPYVHTILHDWFHKALSIKNISDILYYIEFPIELEERHDCLLPIYDESSDLNIVQQLFSKYNVQFTTIYTNDGKLLKYPLGGKAINHHFVDNVNQKYSWHYRQDLHFSPRNSWEANIARLLHYLNIPFSYETMHFTRYKIEACESTDEWNGLYIPDFIIDNKTILEVKGFWDSESRQKALEFTKNYVNYKYYIIDGDFYADICSTYADKIPGWEYTSFGNPYKRNLVSVVGISYGSRKNTVSQLDISQELILEREKDNDFDPYAILVKTLDGNEVGYIAAEWSCIYAPKIDMGMKFTVKVETIERKRVRISIVRSNTENIILYDILKEKD